jgi:hypothetical protein
MPFLKDLFRPSSARPARPARRTWPLLRLSRSDPLPNQLAVTSNDPNTEDHDWDLIEHRETTTSLAVNVSSSLPDGHVCPDDHIEHGPQHYIRAEPARSQHGSKRLRNFVHRLRGSKSQERGSMLSMREALQQTAPDDNRPQASTDSVKRDTNPSNAPIDPESAEVNRNVSSQTAGSHVSKDTAMTVRRRPSQLPLQELEDGWLTNMLNFHQHSDRSEQASKHSSSEHPSSGLPLSDDPILEQHPQHPPSGYPLAASDPFSDGKAADSPLISRVPSKYSDRHGKRPSGNSLEQLERVKTKSMGNSSSKSHTGSRQVSGQSHASAATQASRVSRLSHLDPTKASVAFNALSAKLNLLVHIHPAVAEDIAPGCKAVQHFLASRKLTNFYS